MRAAIVVLLSALVLGVAWFAGEQHVSNCQDAGKTGCTLLPWSGSEQTSEPARKLTGRGCLLYRAAESQDGVYEVSEADLPPECRDR